jgi:hypothetical protein
MKKLCVLIMLTASLFTCSGMERQKKIQEEDIAFLRSVLENGINTQLINEYTIGNSVVFGKHYVHGTKLESCEGALVLDNVGTEKNEMIRFYRRIKPCLNIKPLAIVCFIGHYTHNKPHLLDTSKDFEDITHMVQKELNEIKNKLALLRKEEKNNKKISNNPFNCRIF